MILSLLRLNKLVKEGKIANKYLDKVLDAFEKYVNDEISLEELYNEITSTLKYGITRDITAKDLDELYGEEELKKKIKITLHNIPLKTSEPKKYPKASEDKR